MILLMECSGEVLLSSTTRGSSSGIAAGAFRIGQREAFTRISWLPSQHVIYVIPNRPQPKSVLSIANANVSHLQHTDNNLTLVYCILNTTRVKRY